MHRPKALVTAAVSGPGLDLLHQLADLVLDSWLDQPTLRIYNAAQLAERVAAEGANIVSSRATSAAPSSTSNPSSPWPAAGVTPPTSTSRRPRPPASPSCAPRVGMPTRWPSWPSPCSSPPPAGGPGRPRRAGGRDLRRCRPDPLAALQRLLDSRPGLAHAVGDRSLVEDFARHLLGPIKRAAPLLGALEPQWGHGDWHPWNTAWSSTGSGAVVSGVFDLGLANRTFAVHDLAIALERSTIDWLNITRRGQVEAWTWTASTTLQGIRGTASPQRNRGSRARRAAAGGAPRVHALGGRVLCSGSSIGNER